MGERGLYVEAGRWNLKNQTTFQNHLTHLRNNQLDIASILSHIIHMPTILHHHHERVLESGYPDPTESQGKVRQRGLLRPFPLFSVLKKEVGAGAADAARGFRK